MSNFITGEVEAENFEFKASLGYNEFEANLGYTVRFNKKKKKKKRDVFESKLWLLILKLF